MSKITNDGLTQPGTGCFIAYGNSGRQRVELESRPRVQTSAQTDLTKFLIQKYWWTV